MAKKLYKPLLIDSVTANENLEQYRFVGFDGRHCSAGAKAVGVCDVSTEKDQYAPVGVLGIFLVEASAIITAGAKVTSDANGKAVTVANADEVNGIALDSASAAGDSIRRVRGI
ncbi:MAG: DUF2190 family protein [Lachnospiraceae bacterium]|nr:DUF2190 family protein [Lachnospiraceae bacterium]